VFVCGLSILTQLDRILEHFNVQVENPCVVSHIVYIYYSTTVVLYSFDCSAFVAKVAVSVLHKHSITCHALANIYNSNATAPFVIIINEDIVYLCKV
jgi:hypothetical protein